MNIIHSHAWHCGQMENFNRSNESRPRRNEHLFMEKNHHVLQSIISKNHVYAVICYVVSNMWLDKIIRSTFYLLIIKFDSPESGVNFWYPSISSFLYLVKSIAILYRGMWHPWLTRTVRDTMLSKIMSKCNPTFSVGGKSVFLISALMLVYILDTSGCAALTP